MFTGVVCSDEKGTLLTASFKRIYAASALSAEALALMEALVLGGSLNLTLVIFESDNQCFIETCRGNVRTEEIRGVLDDIKALKLSFQYCGFTWVLRDGNNVTHTTALWPLRKLYRVAGSSTFFRLFVEL